MFTKTLIPAALAVSVLTLSGAAYAETVYLGGPKGMTTIRTTTPAVKTDNAYAQAAPQTRAGATNQVYLGGPKSTIPHARR